MLFATCDPMLCLIHGAHSGPLCTRSNSIDIYDITITELDEAEPTPPPSAIYIAPDPDPIIFPRIDGHPFSTAYVSHRRNDEPPAVLLSCCCLVSPLSLLPATTATAALFWGQPFTICARSRNPYAPHSVGSGVVSERSLFI